jgi:uncharacterized repeat protein (TIGR03803 family)
MRRSTYCFRFMLAAVLCLSLTLLLGPTAMAAGHEKVLYRFTAGADGAWPSSNLLLDASGHLYGIATAGGNTNECTGYYYEPGCGVVFELTPSNGEWLESVLYAFQGGTDGWSPSGNLVFDAFGSLYGTTPYGGNYTVCIDEGCGTVFELSPNGDGAWTKTVLHSFCPDSSCADGFYPSGLIIDKAGNLYGVTTGGGGSNRWGTVYELSPPSQKGGEWTETTLYSFPDYATGDPELAFDSGGNLYGAWSSILSWGTVYELKRIGKSWQETDLYDFVGGGYGGQPKAGVTLDGKGDLFGTGSAGGNDFGIAFELKRSAGHWTESMIYNFCSLNDCVDGANPQAPLLLGPNGVLYGTTTLGGDPVCHPYNEGGCGVVFKLEHTQAGWQENVVYSFEGPPDGSQPAAGLTPDGSRRFYGTTAFGGIGCNGHGCGTVFELTP